MEKLERHFEKELDRLKEALLRLGSKAERAIEESMRALTKRDADLAREIMARDEELDQLELEADQICTDLLALRQPIARDLRFIIMALKIAPELERIGDLAGNIAERAMELAEEPPLKPLIDVQRMASIAREMVRLSLDAFVRRDAQAARAVITRDDELDTLMEQDFRVLLSYMLEDPRAIGRGLRLLMVAKYLERIGDGATNICEMVVYLVEGRVIRHGGIHPVDGEAS
ncbi:MAG TPA: phosphate signaling complex protein PhoU [Patescibacteria group bacterium]|nr:phosphate signaling complex protein PhoU [Patescibacteria group bacterium]